jgi:hypothetical protein
VPHLLLSLSSIECVPLYILHEMQHLHRCATSQHRRGGIYTHHKKKTSRHRLLGNITTKTNNRAFLTNGSNVLKPHAYFLETHVSTSTRPSATALPGSRGGAVNSWFPFIDGVSLPTTSRCSNASSVDSSVSKSLRRALLLEITVIPSRELHFHEDTVFSGNRALTVLFSTAENRY